MTGVAFTANGPGLREVRRARLVVIVAATAVVAASVASVALGGALAVSGDEIPHLLAARRVFDSATPGFAQIGQYWPPLFHVLELPFVTIGPLYRSGLAGAIPAAAMYVVGVVGAFELGRRLTGDPRAGMLAAAAYGANPNLLYLASVPMMETTIAATIVWTAAEAVTYTRDGEVRSLVKAAVWVLLATWAHYATWVMPVHLAVIAVAVAARHRHSVERLRFTVIAASVVTTTGIGLWLLWGWYIQDDALYFLRRGAANAATITASLGFSVDEAAFLAGRPGNLAYVLSDVGMAAWDVLGPLGTLAVVALLAGGLLRGRFEHPVALASWMPVFLVGALFLFGGSLGSPTFAAATGVDTETVARALNENNRYLLYVVPLVAAAAALAAGRSRARQAAVALALVLSLGWFALGEPAVLPHGEQYLEFHEHQRLAARLADLEGTILTNSRNGGDRVIWLAGRPLRTMITEVNGEVFRETLADPSGADHVLVPPGGEVADVLSPGRLALAGFTRTWSMDLYGSGAFRWTLWSRTPEAVT